MLNRNILRLQPLRVISRSTILRYFSQKEESTSHEIQLSEEEKVMLDSLNEYGEAMKHIEKEQYSLANMNLQRVLSVMRNLEQTKTNAYLTVTKKLAGTSFHMLQFKDADKHLNDCIDIAQDISLTNYTLYANYLNVMNFYIRTNVKKAILFGKALLSESEREEIPYLQQKQIIFTLGTAYLLDGNYKDAKSRLRECLLLEPNSELRGMALNNLALCYWWQKIPAYGEAPVDWGVTDEEIDEEFNTVHAMFKNSLVNLEEVSKIEDPQKQRDLEMLLNPDIMGPLSQQEINKGKLFTHTFSAKPILNIAEHIMRFGNNSLDVNVQSNSKIASNWLMLGTKMNKVIPELDFARMLALVALINTEQQNYITAEGLLNTTKDLLSDKFCYERVEAIKLKGILLQNIDNREQEAELEMEQAKVLAEQMPRWYPKLMHVCNYPISF